MNILELLSPAGSFECARAAVHAGADAVYMGGPLFSARAYAESSKDGGKAPEDSAAEDMLLKSIEYCHMRGVRVYMTLNILMKPEEIGSLGTYLEPYVNAGIDGFIVQDTGVMRFLRENYPFIPLHISTQAAVTGPRYAALLKTLGAVRVVPARELSLAELKAIHEEADIEVEAFGHGALCYSCSGQCLMSSVIGGRSGNRGRCAGPCRLPYDVSDENGRKLKGGYLLCMKDLSTVSRLGDIMDAGVCSLKLEGRMKSPVYVAGITSVYRKYIDLTEDAAARKKNGKHENVRVDERDQKILREVFDRGGFTDTYLDRHNDASMVQVQEKEAKRVPDSRIITELTGRYLEKDEKLSCSVSARIKKGEKPWIRLEAVVPVRGLDRPENPENSGNAGNAGASATAGPHIFSVSAGGHSEYFRVFEAEAYGDEPVQEASKRPVSADDIRNRLSKFGNTDFEISRFELEADDGIFITVGNLNELRRKAADELKRRILKSYCRN